MISRGVAWRGEAVPGAAGRGTATGGVRLHNARDFQMRTISQAGQGAPWRVVERRGRARRGETTENGTPTTHVISLAWRCAAWHGEARRGQAGQGKGKSGARQDNARNPSAIHY